MNKINSKDLFASFILVIGYATVFFILQYILFQTGVFKSYPNNISLQSWDANWYESIAHKGYIYWEAANNTGFYILFPLVWNLTHLSAFGISCLNIVFFACGFSLLAAMYRLSTLDKLLWLSIPSLYFMFVPYAEAIFFVLSMACLYGILYKKRYIIWTSLFLVSLTRANAAIFIPMFLLAELLTNDRKDWLKVTWRVLITYCLPILAGLVVFVLYQYYETGIWFAYFKVQSAYWDRKFSMPVLPLTSMWGLKVLWLNALALFMGFIALLVLIKEGVDWLFKNRKQDDQLLLISKLYLAAILFLIIFFNPKWTTHTTNVFGAHRYAFANPFIMIFLYHFIRERKYQVKDYVIVLVLGNLFWLLFGSYTDRFLLLYFNANLILVFLAMLSSHKKLNKLAIISIAIHFVLQAVLFQQFIGKEFTE